VIFMDSRSQRYDQSGNSTGESLSDVLKIVFSPWDGSYFVIFMDSRAQKYDQSGNSTGEHLNDVREIVLSPQGGYFVIYRDLKAQRYDQSGRPVGEHLNDVRAIVLSTQGGYFVNYRDLKAQRYDQSGNSTGEHLNDVREIVFNPLDGSYFVRYSDLKAQRYDISGRPVGEHLNNVRRIVFSPNGERYAVIFRDKNLKFYLSNFMLNQEQELKLKQLVAGLYLGGQIVLKNMLESFKQNGYRPVGLSYEALRYLPVELAELLQKAGYLKPSILMDALKITAGVSVLTDAGFKTLSPLGQLRRRMTSSSTDGQAPASAAGAAAGTV